MTPEPVVVRPPDDEDDEPAPFPPEDEPPDEEPPDDEPPEEDPPDPPPLPPPPPPPFRFHSSSDGEKSVLGFRMSNMARIS